MACENQVGVRNILIKFFDCDNDVTYGPIAHELSGEDQPQYRLCPYTNTVLPGGYVRRGKGNNTIALNIIRNRGIPLALYQGCAAMDISIEHFNGAVITGVNGTGTGDDTSDGHEVSLNVTFTEVDELLPAGALSPAG